MSAGTSLAQAVHTPYAPGAKLLLFCLLCLLSCEGVRWPENVGGAVTSQRHPFSLPCRTSREMFVKINSGCR